MAWLAALGSLAKQSFSKKNLGESFKRGWGQPATEETPERDAGTGGTLAASSMANAFNRGPIPPVSAPAAPPASFGVAPPAPGAGGPGFNDLTAPVNIMGPKKKIGAGPASGPMYGGGNSQFGV